MEPGRRRHPPGCGGSRSTGREGGLGRRRDHPGGGGSRSTGREGVTEEVSSSGRRRLAVHREGGWDREGVVILLAAEARGPPGGREERGGVVILLAAESRGPPGVRAGPGRRRHPTGGGGTRSTEREGETGEASSFSGRRRLAVHREGGRDRGGVILHEAEARGPREGGRHRRGVVILRAAEARGPLGRTGGSRSNGREGGTGEVS